MATTATTTKERMPDAAAATLREVGFSATTARSIARTGDFNQALIFYHWGGVDALLLAALDVSSAERLARYREVLGTCASVPEVLAALPGLYEEDVRSGHVDLLCELVAGGVARRDLGASVAERVAPWQDLVVETLERVLPRPLARRVPAPDVASAVVAFFLGAELLSRLAGERAAVPRSFAGLDRLARLVSLWPGRPGRRAR